MATIPRAARVVVSVSALAGVSACATAQARTAPAPPAPLEVPAPPPRVVIPVTVRVPEPPPDPTPPDPARPPATTGAPPVRPPERPSTPPGQPPATPPVLQPTSNTAALEQKVRELVGTARRNLSRVDRAGLGDHARAQYDTAARFLRMADDALAAKNFLYAQQLAENAAALAGALVRGSAPASAP